MTVWFIDGQLEVYCLLPNRYSSFSLSPFPRDLNGNAFNWVWYSFVPRIQTKLTDFLLEKTCTFQELINCSAVNSFLGKKITWLVIDKPGQLEVKWTHLDKPFSVDMQMMWLVISPVLPTPHFDISNCLGVSLYRSFNLLWQIGHIFIKIRYFPFVLHA